MAAATEPRTTSEPGRAESSATKRSTTVRIPVAVRDELMEIAAAEDRRVGDVIRSLLEERRRRKFWEEMRVAVERTKADPVAWAKYQAEFRLWENATIADGLEEYADDTWE